MIMVVEEVSLVGSSVLWVVWAAVNQSSRSMLVYNVTKAILDLADSLGVKVKICHTGRRTGKGEKVAEHLTNTGVGGRAEEEDEGQDVQHLRG